METSAGEVFPIPDTMFREEEAKPIQETQDQIHESEQILTISENPEIKEIIKKVPTYEVEYIDKVIGVPQPKIVDRIIPEYFEQTLVKEVPDVEVVHVIREVPIYIEKIVEKVEEVEKIEYVDRIVEVPVTSSSSEIERPVIQVPFKRPVIKREKRIQKVERKVPRIKKIDKIVEVPVDREIPIVKKLIEPIEVVKRVKVDKVVQVPREVPREVPIIVDVWPMRRRLRQVPVWQLAPTIVDYEVVEEVY